MIDRDFDDPQTGPRRFHLHLQIPAVSFLAHIKLCERITSDGAERTHVCVTNAVEQLHDPSGNSPGQDLLKIHAAGLALPARARADHEIVRSARNRRHHLRYERWDVAPIAVEKHYDVAFR